MVYSIVLFLHILCAMGYVAGLGIVYACLFGMRRASTVQTLRLWTATATRVTRTVVPISGSGVVLAGLYLYIAAWRGNGSWALVALGAFFLVGLVTGGFQGRWIAMLGARVESLPGDAALTDALTAAAYDRRLFFTSNGTLAVVGGVLFLMVAKPDLILSLVVIACALGVGLGAGALLSRSRRLVAAHREGGRGATAGAR